MLLYYRYGKFAVLDLLDIEDMWPVVERKFDAVQKDLLSNLMSKQLVKEEKYANDNYYLHASTRCKTISLPLSLLQLSTQN